MELGVFLTVLMLVGQGVSLVVARMAGCNIGHMTLWTPRWWCFGAAGVLNVGAVWAAFQYPWPWFVLLGGASTFLYARSFFLADTRDGSSAAHPAPG